MLHSISCNDVYKRSGIFMAVAIMAAIGFIDIVHADNRGLPFQTGEKLTFELKWAFIPAGEAVMEVFPRKTVKGVEAFHFVLTTRSNAFVDQFYMVRDTVESYVDPRVTRSLLYRKKQLEGTSERDIVVDFNWKEYKAQYSNFNKPEHPIDILPGSFDPLSAFFYVRLFELKEKLILERPVTDGKKNVIGKAIVIKRETIKVPLGTFDTFMIEPEVEHIGGVFEKSRGAKIQIWITADQRRIPVKIKSKVVVGSFTGELVSATGLKNP